MTAIARFEARAYRGEADVQPICELINTCNAVDRLDDEPYATPELLQRMIEAPDADRRHDPRVWAWPDGRPAAFAHLHVLSDDAEDEVSARLFFRVHPEARDQGLEERLVEWAGVLLRETAASTGRPAHIRSGLHKTTPEYVAYRQGVLERLGFRPVRYGYKMARPLDLPIPEPRLPAGYTLRHAENDQDPARWVDAFNMSFVDHWDYRPLTLEEHLHHIGTGDYNPKGDLIAVAPGGEVAAFCLCMIHPEDNANRGRSEGFIDILGTRRGHRGIGLGRAMLLAGLHWLKSQGVSTAVLGVDAENPTGALRLYESVGFEVANTTYFYQKDL